MKEIERKWKIKFCAETFAGKTHYERLDVIQFYIGRIRIRKIYYIRTGEEKYTLTIKGDGPLSREEFEVEIPEEIFERMHDDHRISSSRYFGRIIKKYIYTYPIEDNLLLEIHTFIGEHMGLSILECEFPDEETANDFELPEWIREHVIEEVTEDERYQNKNLAVNGLPD